MATKKDLVEAYSFSRRRLVTAFVSGAPGGREVEPARPGRTVVGGVALAVLLSAGAAIAGIFSPTAPSDWKKQGLIISKDTGAAYVIVESSDDPELRPVINATSAKLILDGDAEPMLLGQDTIDDQRIGDDIGIFGAPASVPTPGLLIDSGWTACTAADAGIDVRVTEDPDVVEAPQAGVTVQNDGDLFVVVPTSDSAAPGVRDPGAYLLPVPPQGARGNQTDNLLASLNLQVSSAAIPVSREWLNLFPVGAPLDWGSFGIEEFGATPSYAADDQTGVLADRKVGDLLVIGDERLLLADDGPQELSDFAATVYTNVVTDEDTVVEPIPVDARPRVERQTRTLEGAHWPESLPERAVEAPCAQLAASSGETPVVHLMAPAEGSEPVSVRAGRIEPAVDPGRGAYVLSGGWSDSASGSPFLIDAKGRANALVGDGAAAALGYGEHPVVVVPDTWVKLFACGVNLSRDAALSPPTEQGERSCA